LITSGLAERQPRLSRIEPWARSSGSAACAARLDRDSRAGAALVFATWSYILSVTKSSVAAAAGGAAAASLLVLMGLALVYASREVRLGAARSAA